MFLNSILISFFLISLEFVFSFAIDLRGTSLSDFSVLTNYISESKVSYSIEPLISIARYFYQSFFRIRPKFIFIDIQIQYISFSYWDLNIYSKKML